MTRPRPILPLLAACLNESMRLCPVVVHPTRVAATETRLGSFTLPAGQVVIPCTYLAQHNPAAQQVTHAIAHRKCLDARERNAVRADDGDVPELQPVTNGTGDRADPKPAINGPVRRRQRAADDDFASRRGAERYSRGAEHRPAGDTESQAHPHQHAAHQNGWPTVRLSCHPRFFAGSRMNGWPVLGSSSGSRSPLGCVMYTGPFSSRFQL